MNMRIPLRRLPEPGRWAGSSRRAAMTVLAAIALVISALVAGFAVPKASAASCGTTNIALHQPTTASSVQGASWPASNATDGSLSTRWSSAFSDPQWLEVDLGSAQPICQVAIHWEAAYAKAFQIQTSSDNSTWTTIYSTTTGTGGTQTLSVSGSGRYIRMYGTVRATQYGYSIYELQAYAAASAGNTVTVTNPGTQASKAGTAASLQVQASDSASGQALTYSATGLPAGLSISSSTGLVSGTPTTAGTSTATVTATDTTGASGSASFTWTVSPAGGNTVTVANPGTQTSTVGTAVSLQVQASDSASGQALTYTATGLPAGLSISSTGLITGTPTAASTGSTTVTAKDTTGASGSATFTWTVNTQATGCTGQSNQPNFGPNVYIFNPSMSATTINNTLNTIFNTQKVNQFGTQRYAELFDPGTYNGVEDNVGYYTSVQGLGQNPDDVQLNGDVTVDSFDGTGNATQNFWRSVENMAITPSAGSDRWAVAQAGPFRRMDIKGGLELYPASYGYASGGYIADSKVSGQVASASEQQWYSQDSNFGSWSGSVWNMVFSGVTGAPAQSFPSPPMTTLATTPVVPGRPLPVHRLRRQLPRVRAVPANQLQPARAGRTARPPARPSP